MKKVKELIISEYAKIIAKHIDVDDDGQADTFDMIELAIQIGEDNNLYDNGGWDDVDREKCYNKAYEII